MSNKKMTRKEKKTARKAAKKARKEVMKNASLSVRIRNGAMNVITVCLIGIILMCGYKIGSTYWDYYQSRHAYDSISQDVAKVDPNQFTGVIDWTALEKVNSDIQGWIYQKDTVINYPVVQGDDNDAYLHTRFDKKWGGGGTLFVDYRCESDFTGFNSIIYGHHMKDGSMFRCLRGYTKETGYYDNHKTLELATPEGNYHLLVFSAYITRATDESTYKWKFSSDKEKQTYIDYVYQKSELDVSQSEIPVTTDDKLITLSTCAYDYDDARYIVVCKAKKWTKKEVREGKELQEKIDAQAK